MSNPVSPAIRPQNIDSCSDGKGRACESSRWLPCSALKRQNVWNESTYSTTSTPKDKASYQRPHLGSSDVSTERAVVALEKLAWIACGHRRAVAVGAAVSLQGVRGFRELGICVTSKRNDLIQLADVHLVQMPVRNSATRRSSHGCPTAKQIVSEYPPAIEGRRQGSQAPNSHLELISSTSATSCRWCSSVGE